MCKPSFLTLNSKLLLGKLPDAVFSHTRVLWLPLLLPPPATSHSGVGVRVESSNEIHSVLFTNCFQACGERYF